MFGGEGWSVEFEFAEPVDCRLGLGYRAVYVGKGYGEDLRPAARTITPDAIFVPPMQQVGDALHALDCLIIASPAEGFSMILIESLMAGLPVVATPVGVVLDLAAC